MSLEFRMRYAPTPQETKFVTQTIDKTVASGEIEDIVTNNIETQNATAFQDLVTDTFTLSTPVTDDIRVSADTMQVVGVDSPVYALFRTDGVSPPPGEEALLFNGFDNYSIIPSSVSLNFNQHSFSIGVWIRPDPTIVNNNRIIQKDSNRWYMSVRNGQLRVYLRGKATITAGSLQMGDRNCIVLSVRDDPAPQTDIDIYINNFLVSSTTYTSRVQDLTDVTYFGSRNPTSNFFEGEMDELRVWDKDLDDTEVAQFWNSGVGTTGPVAGGNLVCGYHFNGDTINFGGDPTLNITLSPNPPTYVPGLIDIPSTLTGVYTYFFRPNTDESLTFSVQIPHSYAYGTNFSPHVHWSVTDSSIGNVYWRFEYTLSRIFGTFPVTTTINAVGTTSGAYKHNYTILPDINGSTITTPSAMLICKLTRNGTSGLDTFTGGVALLEFDFHFLKDKLGT